jgi:hypothetical protein
MRNVLLSILAAAAVVATPPQQGDGDSGDLR